MTTHLQPAHISRQPDWDQGISFEAFLDVAEENCDLWTNTYRRSTPSEVQVERVQAVAGDWKLLVLSADWCGDASNTIPHLAAFADVADNVSLHMLDRDDHLDLMDEHLTDGRARSIPVVIVLDEHGVERGWWGPRPADLQAWFVGDESQAMEKDDRYRELRKWYARDKGLTTIAEVLAIIEKAGGDGGVA